MAYTRQTLRVGDLAYFDSMAGAVPCRVLSIRHDDRHKYGTFGATSCVSCTVELTAQRGAYKRGEKLTAWSLHVVPRKSLASNRIRPYDVVVPAPAYLELSA